jgi:hypothetical protein
MSDNGGSSSVPPFPPEYRASGLLLHVTSLPSPYGIGDLGSSASLWVNRLNGAGQRWWQALPLGPTGYGNSPYQSLSSFAGNDLLTSPGGLISDELLQEKDCVADFPVSVVDYDSVIPFKQRLIEKAWTNFKGGQRKDLRSAYDEFCELGSCGTRTTDGKRIWHFEYGHRGRCDPAGDTGSNCGPRRHSSRVRSASNLLLVHLVLWTKWIKTKW